MEMDFYKPKKKSGSRKINQPGFNGMSFVGNFITAQYTRQNFVGDCADCTFSSTVTCLLTWVAGDIFLAEGT